MSRRSKLPLIILVVVGDLAVAQLIRPGRTNPVTDPNHTIAASAGQQPQKLTRGIYERAR